jgi:DNA-binding transcriptional regulator YiaG
MALHFRNVEADPNEPVEQWPYEALVTALERGGLRQWRRVAAEIRRRPWGRTARSVEDYASYTQPSAVTALLLRSVARARSAALRAESLEVAAEVRALVASSGLSRGEFAAAVGTSASRLSTYCTGSVTPSAGLMVRMRRVSADRQGGAPILPP